MVAKESIRHIKKSPGLWPGDVDDWDADDYEDDGTEDLPG